MMKMKIQQHYKIIKTLKIKECQKKLLRIIIRCLNNQDDSLKLFCRVIRTTKGISIYSDIEESFVINITWTGIFPTIDVSYLNLKFFKPLNDIMFEIECWMENNNLNNKINILKQRI